MMKKFTKIMLALMLVMSMVLCAVPVAFAAGEQGQDIVVLYTNDIHCGVDAGSPEGTMGYSNLAALKKELEAQYEHVALVDAGDAIQGDAIGTLSDGDYLIDIMNYLGYDMATYGNHEFDYGMDVALSLQDAFQGDYLSCNFTDLRTGELVAKPYRMEVYGDMKVAYVGISTPETLVKSTPTFFQDEEGNYIYGFCEGGNGQELYDAVQSAIDAATAEGADIVIGLGHLGTEPSSAPWRSYDVIANTTGLDAFIDGHSHSVIEGEMVEDKAGGEVVLTSTGTKLEYIGMMKIDSEGKITTELISGYTNVDAEADAYIKQIQAQFADKLNEVVARTDVALVTDDPATGDWIIRNKETNLGDFCADAYRITFGADIGFINGGGIRAAIDPGEITYGELIAVHPYGNMICVVEASGQEILDTLEVASQASPDVFGSFLHVSGLRYTIDTSVETSVEMDDKGMLVSIGDRRRVKNVEILKDDGSYEPIDPQATYTLASHNYLIKEGGNGVDFFMDNRILQDEVMLDNQVLITYIRDFLGGVVGEEYANPYGQGRITIIDGEQIPETGDVDCFVPVVVILCAAVAMVAVVRKRKMV